MSEQQLVRARADMYRFLASVYLQPVTREFVEQVADEHVLEQMAELFGGAAAGAPRIFAADVRSTHDLAHLKREYMSLFAVPGGRFVAPFEDVYRGAEGPDGNGPLLGEQAIAVIRMYRGAGAEMERACRELPTHVGVELSFMRFLCDAVGVPF